MARVIWKSVLAMVDFQEIEIPSGAEILCAHEQYGEMCVWYLCDTKAPKELRRIVICGTGHPAPSTGRYLGTCALGGGRLQMHVFECAD